MRTEDGDYPLHPGNLTHIWLAFDLANGVAGRRWEGFGYCWWFRTRAAAREHVRKQNETIRHAPLTPPVKYGIVKLELLRGE